MTREADRFVATVRGGYLDSPYQPYYVVHGERPVPEPKAHREGGSWTSA
jgi:hypothetical protein